MDIRRTILLMIFAFSLLMLWNNWQMESGNGSLFDTSTTSSTNKPIAQTPQSSASTPNGVPQAPVMNQGSQSAPALVVPPTTALSKPFVVKTDVLQLTFDLIGAQIVQAELLKFPSTEDKSKPTLLLEQTPAHTYVVQTGLTGAPEGQSYPTHLSSFTPITSETEMTGDTLPVSFVAESDGVRLTKTFTLHRGTYAIDVDHKIENLTASSINPSVYLQISRDGRDPENTSSFYHTFTGPAVYTEAGKFQKISFSDIEKNKTEFVKQADNGWIAMIQHYFVTAWVPVQGQQRYYDMAEVQKDIFAVRAIEPVGTVEPSNPMTVKSSLWVGPQDQSSLEALAPGLDLVVDYGWLTIIAKPLFILMTWLHSILGNWGWTIVALTVVVKAIFYPLSAASYKSMAKMKQVAPRLTALREKFGGDKQKLNMAMMEMYKTEKINPLGGCLPIVVQIPVFISLYWVLLASVEMRGAQWVLWVDDLSVRDPFFILPAVMMATMFLQMSLNPKPPDPMQAKVMMFMPVIFGGMMFFFPAGLVLYWCVNNTLSIAQQWYITQKINKAQAVVHR
ncbi:MAG: membrane protein insertase YidC [Burkholderiaceae bacterium]|nr:membrane protein insertase YidC [Burkholderiaceae bacterium]